MRILKPKPINGAVRANVISVDGFSLHPNGAVIWVTLDSNVEAAVRAGSEGRFPILGSN